jgi:tetratricopeptide (TPR) repeat protein
LLCALCGLLLLAAPGLHAGDAGLLDSAEEAMAARLPQVAIVKLDAFLTSSAALDDTLRERAEQDLTHAMLDAGDAVGALARLEYPSSETERFWKAGALSSLGRWDDAAPLYEEVAADGPSSLQEAAAIGQAEALRADGRDEEALAVLERLETRSSSTLVRLRLAELYLDNEQPDGRQLDPARALLAGAKPATLLETRWRQYVEGRIYLAEDQDAPALEDFQELLNDPEGLTPALHVGATIGLAEARAALNGFETGDDVLEDFIWHHPESPYLDEMFRRLDAMYAAEENPSESELQHWASTLQAQAEPRRAALALYYEARSLQRQGRQEKAIGKLTEFLQRFPSHPFAFEAWMQLGQLNLDTGRVPAAIAAFEGAMRYSASPLDRARGEIATGNAHFAQGDFLVAAEHFHDAAARCPDLWLQATYDSALAWLHIGNYDRFLQDYTALSQSYPETDERRNLLLEEGLLQARSGDPRATATLESFVRDFPDNRRVAEAQIALAELVFADGDMDSASHLLRAAYVSAPSPQSREQADYLAIFIADSSPHRSDDEVIRLGRKFLDAWPSSALRPQVRMKLGEIYFRAEDFANAQTQFETLAQESPSDPLADKALILAGQSSVRGMSSDGIRHALDLFDLVAKGSGPLRLYARQEQALLKARQGLDNEAVIIYDDILRSNPDTPLRLAALCGKADCLVAAASGASSDASTAPSPGASPAPSPGTAGDGFSTAVALYDQIAADPDATAPWRNEALYKKGRCLSKQGLTDQALAAFYDVLNGHSSAPREQPDFFWFEKAGYDAAAMLEAKAQWPGAISILEKVAQAGGPRSAEARKRADQLRLEHFVWD